LRVTDTRFGGKMSQVKAGQHDSRFFTIDDSKIDIKREKSNKQLAPIIPPPRPTNGMVRDPFFLSQFNHENVENPASDNDKSTIIRVPLFSKL
jgi:hypothetical protein